MLVFYCLRSLCNWHSILFFTICSAWICIIFLWHIFLPRIGSVSIHFVESLKKILNNKTGEVATLSQNNLNLRMDNKPVTAGPDATVYRTLYSTYVGFWSFLKQAREPDFYSCIRSNCTMHSTYVLACDCCVCVCVCSFAWSRWNLLSGYDKLIMQFRQAAL